jgi:hypothetical protein
MPDLTPAITHQSSPELGIRDVLPGPAAVPGCDHFEEQSAPALKSQQKS